MIKLDSVLAQKQMAVSNRDIEYNAQQWLSDSMLCQGRGRLFGVVSQLFSSELNFFLQDFDVL